MCVYIPLKCLLLKNPLRQASQHSRPAIPRACAGKASLLLLLFLFGVIITKWLKFWAIFILLGWL